MPTGTVELAGAGGSGRLERSSSSIEAADDGSGRTLRSFAGPLAP